MLLFTATLAWADTNRITLNGLAIDYSPFAVVTMPGEVVEIGLPENKQHQLRAPDKPGYYPSTISLPGGEQIIANLFVLVPATRMANGVLNGYRIGDSPPAHTDHPQAYSAPRGFIEVTEDMLDIQVSPHFRLQQFLCKQESDFPKYIALKESLPVLLEGLLQAVQEKGYPASAFGVISGYRTPWYNKRIGNVANSRHVYGDAMDLFLDIDNDGRHDDMDRDGDRDLQDVQLLYDIALEFMNRPENAAVVGGLGRYGQTSRHGGFLHVDTRGHPARW